MNEAKRGPLPPVFLLGALLLEWGLHVYLPITRLVPEAWSALGVIPIAMGVGVMIVAAGQFRKAMTVINPFDQPVTLVTSGLFGMTRNPMYSSMIAILIGGALAWGTLTPFLLPPAMFWVLSRKFIPMEESNLSEAFGEDYDRYKGRVRRWL